jgi:hypothetical protein
VPDRSITEAIAQSGNLSRIGNHPCPCGSGRKTKKCCGAGAALQEVEDEARRRERREAKAAARRHAGGNRGEF